MDVVGVIAEYNPLHRGHLRHLALTRERLSEATVVVCMSGNWVQRGDCAVTDKWRRARAACAHGADLVLELPSVFAVSSAPRFAQGAVALLAAAGASCLSFGCENAQLPQLQALARCLEDPAFSPALRPFLDRGLSYPAARQKAAEALLGPETAQLLSRPNNNLAVEYLRALPEGIAPVPIPRAGTHTDALDQPYPCASALRAPLRAGQTALAQPHLAQPWEGPVYDLNYLERTILARLRLLSPAELAALPDGGDGLAQRLWSAARQAATLPELYALAKTKRLTEARVRRAVLWALWGLTEEDRPQAPGYLRVLAMTQRGAQHLAALKTACPLPIITKAADHKDLLAPESRLTDLFSLCAPHPLPAGEEFRRGPRPTRL